jgi:hypothetical protein
MTRIRVPIFVLLLLLVTAVLGRPALTSLAFTGKNESVEQLIARSEIVRPEDRPALYVEIARRKADAADKLYNDGNAEAGKAALQDVLTYFQKATDSSIATGKKQKDTEITLRKMAAKFRDLKRTVVFEDQAPIQKAVDDLERMRTDLLAAMFGKKKNR